MNVNPMIRSCGRSESTKIFLRIDRSYLDGRLDLAFIARLWERILGFDFAIVSSKRGGDSTISSLACILALALSFALYLRFLGFVLSL